MNWIDACYRLQSDGVAFVLVSIDSIEGSTPRALDAKMVVSADHSFDSIGGGKLEFDAIDAARAMLHAGENQGELKQSLGPATGQCCGGRVGLRFERISRAKLVVFGGGHVAQALAGIVSGLNMHCTVYDQREQWSRWHAEGVKVVQCEDPVASAQGLQADKVLIMTHDHQLDLALCAAVLGQSEVGFVGLIGSASKAAKFRSQLKRMGLENTLHRLQSPIGESLGKRPVEVAVAISAAMLKADIIQPLVSNNTHSAAIDADPCGSCRRCDTLLAGHDQELIQQ